HKAYLRTKYLNQLAEYRKLQVEFIKTTQSDLDNERISLEKNLAELQVVLKSKDEEKRSYENDKSKQRDLLQGLKEEENKLKHQLDDHEEARRRLAQE